MHGDDEGSDFEFANIDELDEEGAKFVRETHHDFDKWDPEDKQGNQEIRGPQSDSSNRQRTI